MEYFKDFIASDSEIKSEACKFREDNQIIDGIILREVSLKADNIDDYKNLVG